MRNKKYNRKAGPCDQHGPVSADSSAAFPGGEVLAHHQRHLKHNGMVKLPQVKTGELLDLFQTVNQRVAVDEQFPGSLGYIQIILKEFIDSEQRFLIQRIDGILLEHLAEEYLAKGGGQLV